MATKIFVPLDGSPLAEAALPTAVALANRTQGDLVLVRIVEQDVLLGDPVNSIDHDIVAVAADYMADVRDRLINPAESTAFAPERVRVRTLSGSRGHAIRDAIATENPDVIVMTTHARKGFSRFLLGSFAQTITKKANVPVLLIHPDENNPSSADLVGPILVTLDGSPEAEAILVPAIALAQSLHTSIALLQVVIPVSDVLNYGEFASYVNENAAAETEESRQTAIDYLAQMRTRVAGYGVPCTSSVRVDSGIVPLITAYAREISAGMVAMATHARGRIGEIVLGSVADGVIRTAQMPVLVTHSHTPAAVTSEVAAVAES